MSRSMTSRGGETTGEAGYPRVTPGQSELPFPDEHALRHVGEHIGVIYSEAVADKTKRAIETQRGLPRGSLG